MLQRAAIPSQNILRLTLCLCHGTLLSVYHVAPATIVESENLTRLAIDWVGLASCCVVPSTGGRVSQVRTILVCCQSAVPAAWRVANPLERLRQRAPQTEKYSLAINRISGFEYFGSENCLNMVDRSWSLRPKPMTPFLNQGLREGGLAR